MKESGFRAGAARRFGVNQIITALSERSVGRISVVRESASLLAISLLFFSGVVGLQWLSGAYQNEFGGDPDEAAHYVTGLMMRDYLTVAPLSSPMSFAQNYYLHYPKVALGHWPPLFYIVQTVWGLLFTSSRFSMLLLMALTTALLAATVCRVIRSEFGTRAGIAMGMLVIFLPMTQENSSLLMADMLFMLISFWAAICFGRYLDAMKARDAIGFGVFASLTILTKGNGLVLVLVPPVALLLSRRFHLVARASFWYPAGIVLLLCGPWYLSTRKMWQGITETGLSPRDTIEAISFYSWQLIKIGGVGLSLLMVIGFFVQIIKPFRGKAVRGKWAAAGALLLSVWLFYCIEPSGNNNRYLLVVVPTLLMFFAAG
ncbi:MAG: ArnT family glycosyltransferase, partial [Nitrososphaerales archaeon]